MPSTNSAFSYLPSFSIKLNFLVASYFLSYLNLEKFCDFELQGLFENGVKVLKFFNLSLKIKDYRNQKFKEPYLTCTLNPGLCWTGALCKG